MSPLVWSEMRNAIIGLIYILIVLLILFKFKKQQSQPSFIISVISLVIAIICFVLIGLLFLTGSEMAGLFIYGFFVVASISLLISSFYKNKMELQFYQKFRTTIVIVVILFDMILIMFSLFHEISSGNIGHISQQEAQQKAQEAMVQLATEEDSPTLLNSQCQFAQIYHEVGDTPIVYSFSCTYDNETYLRPRSRVIDINAKNGAVGMIGNELK